MIDFSGKRWMLVALVSYVALFLVSQANHYLAALGIHCLALGMVVSFCALELSFRQGMLALVPVAFYVDSQLPLPFGFSLVLMLCLFTAAHAASSRLRREITASALVTSLGLNLAAFLAYTAASAYYLGPSGLHFGTFVTNLAASSLVVGLFNKFFFQTQIAVLYAFGVDLAAEQRELR